MTTIGILTATGTGYSGYISTRTFQAAVTMRPASRSSPDAPAYTVRTGSGRFVGVAWRAVGSDDATVLRLRLIADGAEHVQGKLVARQGVLVLHAC